MWIRTILGLGLVPLLATPGCSRSPRATPGSSPAVDAVPPVATADAAAGADASNAAPAPLDATSSPPVIVDPELARRIEKAARSTEPFVRWLSGEGDERPGPPAVFAEAAGAGGGPSEGATAAVPSFLRTEDALHLMWQAAGPTTKSSCSEAEQAARDLLAARDFDESPRGDPAMPAFSKEEAAVRTLLAWECTDARDQRPRTGCAGSDCDPRTTIAWSVGLEIPAPPFGTVADAFALFPRLQEALAGELLPAFLADRLAATKIRRILGETFSDALVDELMFWVTPPGDARAWILEDIEAAKEHGFLCDESWKDPAREDLRSVQECSGYDLWHHLDEDGVVRVRLAAVRGAPRSGSVAGCSRDFRPAPAPPADPDVETVLEVRVSRRAVAHIDRTAECIRRHHAAAGRALAGGDWRRLGNFLERHLEGNRISVEDIAHVRAHSAEWLDLIRSLYPFDDPDCPLAAPTRQQPEAGG